MRLESRLILIATWSMMSLSAYEPASLSWAIRISNLLIKSAFVSGHTINVDADADAETDAKLSLIIVVQREFANNFTLTSKSNESSNPSNRLGINCWVNNEKREIIPLVTSRLCGYLLFFLDPSGELGTQHLLMERSNSVAFGCCCCCCLWRWRLLLLKTVANQLINNRSKTTHTKRWQNDAYLIQFEYQLLLLLLLIQRDFPVTFFTFQRIFVEAICCCFRYI